jgi:hypothetical protein
LEAVEGGIDGCVFEAVEGGTCGRVFEAVERGIDKDPVEGGDAHSFQEDPMDVDLDSERREAVSGHQGYSPESRTTRKEAKSTKSRRNALQLAKDGKLSLDPGRAFKFESTCKKYNKDAGFKYDDITQIPSVWCPSCDIWVKMKALYDTNRFKNHVNKSCKRKGHQTNLKVVPNAACTPVNKKAGSAPRTCSGSDSPADDIDDTSPVNRPCFGLSVKSLELGSKIETYLARTGAEGGGARSLKKITQERYGKDWKDELTFADLDEACKEEVYALQYKEFKWVNIRGHGVVPSAVFSTHCEGLVSGSDDLYPVCEQCLNLWKDGYFRQQVQRRVPDPEHAACNPNRYKRKDDMSVFAQNSGLAQCFDPVSANFFSHFEFV